MIIFLGKPVLLGVILFTVYALFYQGQDWATISILALYN